MTARPVPRTSPPARRESDVDQLLEQRLQFRTRHAKALTELMDQRTDLRGVHALADLVDDAVRWCA